MSPRHLPLVLAALGALLSCADDPVGPSAPVASSAQWDATLEAHSAPIRALWGDEESGDVYVVGALVARYDGATWRPVARPATRLGITTGWCGPGDNLYLVSNTRIYHWNGTAWDYIRAPYGMRNVWGAPSGEIFVTSYNYGWMQRFDGATWAVDSLDAELSGVWGSRADDVYVTGDRGRICHWDGSAWTVTSIDSNAYFVRAWRADGGPLRVTDWNDHLYESGSVLARLDPGVDFRVLALVPQGPQRFVAAGYLGDQYPLQGAAYTFDGAAWASLSLSGTEYTSVWPAPNGDVYAGGPGVWRHRRGVPQRILGGEDPAYRAEDLWTAPEGDVIAVGRGAHRFDGTTWTDLQKEAFVTQAANAVHGLSAHDFYAVGRGMVLHYENGAWNWIGTGYGADLLGVWASPAGVMVVGWDGTIAAYDGKGWTRMESHTRETLYDIWGWDDGAFAVGSNGVILRFDGREWRPEASPVSFRLRQVLGFGPNHVFATGDRASEILRFDGRVWKAVPTGNDDPTAWNTDLWGTSASDLFVAQDEGMVFHFDGRTWSPLSPPLLERTYAIAGLRDGGVLVGGDQCLVRYHPRGAR